MKLISTAELFNFFSLKLFNINPTACSVIRALASRNRSLMKRREASLVDKMLINDIHINQLIISNEI